MRKRYNITVTEDASKVWEFLAGQSARSKSQLVEELVYAELKRRREAGEDVPSLAEIRQGADWRKYDHVAVGR